VNIGISNPKVIEALIKVLETTQNDYTRRIAAQRLEKIGTRNLKTIEVLINVLETSPDDYTRMQAARSLEKIDPGNPKAIEALIKVLETTSDDYTFWIATVTLVEIDPGNPKAIEALIKVKHGQSLLPCCNPLKENAGCCMSGSGGTSLLNRSKHIFSINESFCSQSFSL